MVDGARVIKRMRPAPQGRGYRVRKRSNHVTLVVDEASAKATKAVKVAAEVEEAPVAKKAATKKAAPKKAAVKNTKSENE